MRAKRKKKRDDALREDIMLVTAITSLIVSVIALIRGW